MTWGKEWEISIWLAKNIGKYHTWLWSSQVKILDLSQVAEGHEWCSNIFSQVMTITTSDIFQYFCQPCNNYGHKYVLFHKITQEYYYHAIINCNIKIILYLETNSSEHSKSNIDSKPFEKGTVPKAHEELPLS